MFIDLVFFALVVERIFLVWRCRVQLLALLFPLLRWSQRPLP